MNDDLRNVGNYQTRVWRWVRACFGLPAAYNRQERIHYFLKAAFELAHAANCTREEAHEIVDYVFDRPKGDARHALGGCCVMLSALASVLALNVVLTGEDELSRCWDDIEKIRLKSRLKPVFGAPSVAADDAPEKV